MIYCLFAFYWKPRLRKNRLFILLTGFFLSHDMGQGLANYSPQAKSDSPPISLPASSSFYIFKWEKKN